MLKSRSALDHCRAQPGGNAADRGPGLRLGEIEGTALVQLGIYPGGAGRVAASVLPILGRPLPESAHCAAVADDCLILRIAPDQYWIVGGDGTLEARLRASIPADAGCVTALHAARTRLSIEGDSSRALLGRLVAVDLHPALFPIHSFAQTGIHHVGGLLLRVAEDRYEFFALRTYAVSTWELLCDAARSFGFQIALTESKT